MPFRFSGPAPQRSLDLITGSHSDFSGGEQAGVVFGVPAAEIAAGSPLIHLHSRGKIAKPIWLMSPARLE